MDIFAAISLSGGPLAIILYLIAIAIGVYIIYFAIDKTGLPEPVRLPVMLLVLLIVIILVLLALGVFSG